MLPYYIVLYSKNIKDIYIYGGIEEISLRLKKIRKLEIYIQMKIIIAKNHHQHL